MNGTIKLLYHYINRRYSRSNVVSPQLDQQFGAFQKISIRIGEAFNDVSNKTLIVLCLSDKCFRPSSEETASSHECTLQYHVSDAFQ